MSEQWKLIEDYPNYEVSNMGRVRSSDRMVTVERKGKKNYKLKIYGKILKPTIHNNGYKAVGLYNNGKTKQICVHRLVAKYFVDNPNNYSQVDHIDGNKLNNQYNNLEWVTLEENVSRAHKNMLMNYVGKKCQYMGTGEIFDSMREADRRLNLPTNSVYQYIRKNRKYKGFHFKLI